MVEILIDFTVSFLVALYVLVLIDLTQWSWRYTRATSAPWPLFLLVSFFNLLWPFGLLSWAIGKAFSK